MPYTISEVIAEHEGKLLKAKRRLELFPHQPEARQRAADEVETRQDFVQTLYAMRDGLTPMPGNVVADPEPAWPEPEQLNAATLASFAWGYLESTLEQVAAGLDSYAERLPEGCESYLPAELPGQVAAALDVSRRLAEHPAEIVRLFDDYAQSVCMDCAELRAQVDDPRAICEDCARSMPGGSDHTPPEFLGWDGDAPDEDRSRDR